MATGTRRWSPGVLCLALAFVVGVVLTLPEAVRAHAILVESVPSHGASLERSPSRITLRFNATLELSMVFVHLVDLQNVKMPLGIKPESTPSQIVAEVPPLSPGVYTVVYKVLARDGHVTEGTLRFTILEH